MHKEQENKQIAEENRVFFPLVVIGAGEGGVEGLTELFTQLPANTGMGFVYIENAQKKPKHAVEKLLQQATTMVVSRVSKPVTILKDHVYILPPDATVTINNGVLTPNETEPSNAPRLVIDQFMLHVAETWNARSIGIVLSGVMEDAALGLKAIKSAGGITYAQDESAPYPTMPRAAIAQGSVDNILPPAEMAKELDRLSKLPGLQLFYADNDESPLLEEQQQLSGKIEELEPVAPILQMLKIVVGVDFTHYKENTIKRRILRRMILFKMESVSAYLDYLKKNKSEIHSLYNDLLINVTHFFRDPDAVELLSGTILPQLLNDRSYENPLRIWVPACSTGEEAYSMAMLIIEAMGDRPNLQAVEIFATDLSEQAITKARIGAYAINDLGQVSPERLQKFFSKIDGHYRINKSIRDMCVFAPQNLFKDPPFSRINLVSCCNLLIYLDIVLQKKIMANFHYALKPNGYLLLGKSETTNSSSNLFVQIDKKVKIYQKKNDTASRAMFELNYHLPTTEPPPVVPRREAPKMINTDKNVDKIIDNLLLTQFAKAAVVVSFDMEIAQFRGSTGLYLEPSPGKASLNLIKMARPGLALELRNGAHQAIKENRHIEKNGIEINYKGNMHRVGFEIIPLLNYTNEKLLLIVFDEQKFSSLPEKASLTKDRKLKQVEAELISLREDMRSIVEEQEAANEELQSANEEIVSSNEELQSINEELETSKEELESSNEELLTINQELQMRNEQLAESQEYTESIIYTIRESVLVLDSSLRIRVVNRAFYNTFKVREEDTEGKYIFEMHKRQWNIPKLKELLEVLLPSNGYINGYEIKHSFDSIGEKVLLLNARVIKQKVHRQQFVLLAIEDITEHRQAERLLEEREAWLRNMTDNVPVMIWVAGADKNFTYLNKTWLEFTGRNLRQEIGIGWTEGVHKSDLEHTLTTYHESFEQRSPFRIEYRMKRKDGEYRWILNHAVPTFSADGEFTGYTGSCVEIHDKRLMNDELEKRVHERTQALQESNIKLEKSNNELQQFAYVVSHDLQEPLRKIVTFSNRIKEQQESKIPFEGKDYLDKISTSAERMRGLIDDLLNFSRITRIGAGFVQTDLNQVVKNSLANLDLLIQETNTEISVEPLPKVNAVPVQINQLFDNLIGNAIKFVRTGFNPVIRITCRMLTKTDIEGLTRLKPAGTYYDIMFSDQGIGFDPTFAEQIFVIFQRLNPVGNYAGTGIGLALCRKIAENHGGWIYAESKENEGSIFHLILPSTKMNGDAE
ncbi:PAS domain S-box protein [Segetibacter sp. 3557_3]|uniref:CheR family methyltransferase n=1 Tax=Segetibacter sp. 3557_3 TaxID=2547429 RepID=UPI0010586B07|nr:CheR family methyltransferase [Segetibacter sp. 3557_3]TDH27940.1 PAS domain S-box protein [Segetibacter sp. 3557_3]